MSLSGASKQRHARGEQPSASRKAADPSGLYVANSSDNRGNEESKGVGNSAKQPPKKAESASKLARRQLSERKASDAASAYSGKRNPIMNAPNGFALAKQQLNRGSQVASSQNP